MATVEPISAAEVERASMVGVANRPGQRNGFGNAGMTPLQLKERYSALAMLGIEKLNEVIAMLGNGTSESDLLSMLYTQYSDETDDTRRVSLAAWIDRIELAMKNVSEQSVPPVSLEDEGDVLTVQGGKAVWEPRKEQKPYGVGDGLTLNTDTYILSVDTADAVEKDNTKPITAAAVYTEIGNIEALLGTI